MEVTEKMLKQYFNGQCTETELVAVEGVLLDPGNSLFDSYFAEIVQSTPVPAGTSIVAQEERKKLFRQLGIQTRLTGFLKYAAAAVLLITAGTFWYKADNKKPHAIVRPISDWVVLSNPSATAIERVKLEDGTIIYLNSNASLCYDRAQFNKEQRSIEFEGEGYFEVAPNPEKPFSVWTKGISTTVKGTKFNIEAYSDETAVHITLLEGKVEVVKKERRVMMKPDERLSIDDRMNFSLRKVGTDPFNDWIENGDMVFNNMPLEEVLKRISNLYGISIVANDSVIQKKYIQGRFKRQSSDAVMKKVLFIHNLHYKKTSAGALMITP